MNPVRVTITSIRIPRADFSQDYGGSDINSDKYLSLPGIQVVFCKIQIRSCVYEVVDPDSGPTIAKCPGLKLQVRPLTKIAK